MTIKHFQVLRQEAQCETAMCRGAFLADRFTEDFNILLFQLDAFYVELYYYTHIHEIAFVKSFNSTAYLDPYLVDIDLSNLV